MTLLLTLCWATPHTPLQRVPRPSLFVDTGQILNKSDPRKGDDRL